MARVNLKRKILDSAAFEDSAGNNAKRAKIISARSILAQSSDKSLNETGELDVSAFVKAREYEIQALEASMGASKKGLASRAFQQVPRELRRRTASHNVKKVPKRLRARATKEMKEDKTPTVTSRNRTLSAKQHLRMENVRKLGGLGTRSKAKREAAKKLRSTREESDVIGETRQQEMNPNTLVKPPAAVSKFRKRQVHKSWLPTHLYHAKRAHMTNLKDPLWKFAIPLTPTEKSYRATHRAGAFRGCMAWDVSYLSTVGILGVELSVLGFLRSLGVPEDMLIAKQGSKWRAGSRAWYGWLRERDGERLWMARVGVIWSGMADEYSLGKLPKDATISINPVSDDLCERKRPLQRRLFLRMHPAAFLQVWNESLKVGKMQRPPVTLEDLRFEIGSIEITGPGATEALAGALCPVAPESGEIAAESHPNIWNLLRGLTNPASVPLNALLAFSVSDPRLRQPAGTLATSQTLISNNELLQLLSAWPPDRITTTAALFDHKSRFTASRLLPSQKSINRRKGDAIPGCHPDPLPTDPKIPVILLASRPESNSRGQGSWTLLLPWKCVVPFWYSLMYYPLSSGGNPRFGGLQQVRQICFEQGVPWFPADFAGTTAGWGWELQEREKRKADWEKRPKAKRVEWESVDLGRGNKGEIGLGWACDWERLFLGPCHPPPKIDTAATTQSTGSTQAQESPRQPALLKLVHIPPAHLFPLPAPTAFLSHALITVRILLLHRGVPTICARIYCLPSTNAPLRERWLAVASPSRTKACRNSGVIPSRANKTPCYNEGVALASTSLSNFFDSEARLQANSDNYPAVPGEKDLIGFVTSGNFNLGEGKGTGLGCVALDRVRDVLDTDGKKGGLCIIREAGMTVGRIGTWEVVC